MGLYVLFLYEVMYLLHVPLAGHCQKEEEEAKTVVGRKPKTTKTKPGQRPGKSSRSDTAKPRVKAPAPPAAHTYLTQVRITARSWTREIKRDSVLAVPI